MPVETSENSIVGFFFMIEILRKAENMFFILNFIENVTRKFMLQNFKLKYPMKMKTVLGMLYTTDVHCELHMNDQLQTFRMNEIISVEKKERKAYQKF